MIAVSLASCSPIVYGVVVLLLTTLVVLYMYMSCALSNEAVYSLGEAPVEYLRDVEYYRTNLLRLCNLGLNSPF